MAPKTFNDWKSCCKYLFELIGRNKVLAGENTIIEDTGSGIRVHAQAGGSGGSGTYDGNFTVFWMGEDTDQYRIVYMANNQGSMVESTTLAGYVTMRMANIQNFAVPKTVLSANNGDYIYVLTTFNTAGISTAAIYAASALPSATTTTQATAIARIENRVPIKIQTGAINFAWRIGNY